MDKIDFIWNKVNGLRFGAYDFSKDEIVLFEDERFQNEKYFLQNCRILFPEEVEKFQYGTCVDQCLYIVYLAKEMNISFRIYLISSKAGNYHCVCFLNNISKWYYIESAWNENRGIYSYSSLIEGKKNFLKKYFSFCKENILFFRDIFKRDRIIFQ